MEKRNLEQRCAIKICVKPQENASEIYEKLRAYGEHTLSRTQVSRWHKAFLDGPECGRPCTSTEENETKVRDLERSDRRFTVRMISVLNLNRQTVHEITFELCMQKI